MSPKRSKETAGLPSRVTLKHGSYYYLRRIIKNGKAATQWVNLGKTEAEMLRALAELKTEGAGVMAAVIQRYREQILIKKAANTQASQNKQLDRLQRAFGHGNPSKLRPSHIAQYHDAVGATAPYQANRELALLTHVLKYAVRWGYIDENPAREIQRHPEHARTRYPTHDEYTTVRNQAPIWIQILMDLAYITGQRRADLLSLQRKHLTDAGIEITQSKTGKKLLLEWSTDLHNTVTRALTELASPGIQSVYVICDRNGQRRRDAAFTTAWTRHINKCLTNGTLSEPFQFRDIRAKAGSDSDGKQLGHQSEATLKRHYKRLPENVKPTQ
jgi:integrase